MADYFIVMGDIIGSSKYDGGNLMLEFKTIVSSCNEKLSTGILSPYTITLGMSSRELQNHFIGVSKAFFYWRNSFFKEGFPLCCGMLSITERSTLP